MPNHWSPRAWEPVLSNKRGHHNEKPAHHSWRVAPCSLQLEKSPRSSEDPAQPKLNQSINLITLEISRKLCCPALLFYALSTISVWSMHHQSARDALGQGSPTRRIYCLMIWGGADVIVTEMKCTIIVIHLNHLETTPPLWSMEGLSSAKPVPVARKVGVRCLRLLPYTWHSNHEVRDEWVNIFSGLWVPGRKLVSNIHFLVFCRSIAGTGLSMGTPSPLMRKQSLTCLSPTTTYPSTVPPWDTRQITPSLQTVSMTCE